MYESNDTEFLLEKIEASKMIHKQIALLASEKNMDAVMTQVLASVGEFINAERVYIFEEREGSYPNTYEWCAPGATARKQDFQNFKKKDLFFLTSFFEKNECVIISDIEVLNDTFHDAYEVFKKYNVHSLIVAPIMICGERKGFIGADNAPPETARLISDSLVTLGSFIGITINNNIEHKNLLESYEVIKNTNILRDTLVNSVGSGIFAYTLPDHEIIMLNQEAKRLFDCPKEHGTNEFYALLNDKIPEADFLAMRNITINLKNAGDEVEYIFHIRKDCGEHLTVKCHSRLLSFSNGQLYIISAMSDITNQEKLEKTLYDERSQYRDALMLTCYFSITADLTDGYIRHPVIANDGTVIVSEDQLPLSFDDFMDASFIGRNAVCLTKDANLIMKRHDLINTYNKGIPTFDSYYYISDIDKYYHTLVLLYEQRNTGHINVNLMIYDATKKKKEENEMKVAMQQAYEAAQKANLEKTKFYSNMSHDIRTPLNAIIGMATVACTDIDNKKQVEDCLNKINVSSKYLLGLVNEVLDIHKIEEGQLELHNKEFDLLKTIDATLSIIKQQVKEKNQTFSLSIDGIKHNYVIGDSQKLQQVLQNLLSNSNKYTPAGGKVTFTVTEAFSGDDKTGMFEFVIQDNGIGMSEEYVEHMFEPFSRADDARVNKILGTGLGMSIVKSIVQMMNGTIKVESKLNEGTKFTLRLRLNLQDSKNDTKKSENVKESTDIPVKARATDDASANATEKRILVAEDYEMNWEILDALLPNYGFILDLAEDGQMCVDKFIASEIGYYAAILMDLRMPVKNGYEATADIRGLTRADANVPIIAMSADAFDADVQACKAAGMDDHIAKPIDFKILVEILNRLT